MDTFPWRLRVSMAANDVTVRDVIERSRLPKSHVYRILNGETIPTPATRARLILAVFAEDVTETRPLSPTGARAS